VSSKLLPNAIVSRLEHWRTILKIAWPLIVANSFWNLQLTIDRIYLGTYSTEALGAAMAVMGVFWVPMALLQQTASYVMTFVAQFYGAKRLDQIGPAVWQSTYLSLIGGFLILLLIPLSTWLFGAMGHSEKMAILEVEYFNALCYSALPTALVAVASGFFTGLGQTKVIIQINCVGFLANLVMDYVLIFGNLGFPALGVAGAGYATAIANAVAAVYGFYLVFKPANEAAYRVRSGWRWNPDLMLRTLRYGVPSGMQWALEGLAFTVFLLFVGRMPNGDAGLAASGIVVTVMMLAVLPSMGIAQAGSVLVGQFLGEKRPELAEQSTWSGLQVVLLYIVAISASFVLLPQFYLSWFHNSSNPELWGQVEALVPYLFLYLALFSSFDSANMVFSFALKGAGDTRFVTFVALLVPWPLMVLPTWFMKDWDGAIFWAWGAASLFIIVQALVFWRRFVGGRWKAMSVIG
jgi:multidrug resistance protein, MATE family